MVDYLRFAAKFKGQGRFCKTEPALRVKTLDEQEDQMPE